VVELSVQIVGHMLDILSVRVLAIFLFKYFVGVWDFSDIVAVIFVLGSIDPFMNLTIGFVGSIYADFDMFFN